MYTVMQTEAKPRRCYNAPLRALTTCILWGRGIITIQQRTIMKSIICCFSVLVLLVAVVAVWWSGHSHSQEPERHRFGSFSPVRDGHSQVKWLVDGQEYMSAVADAIDAAEHEIFITDWQIHPNVFLKRPDDGVTSLDWRLDKLLLRKADKDGVRIYILLYWETKLAMDLGSDYAILALNHTNIKIQRHPSYITPVSHPSTLLRWSHHEKIVVVDRSIAFVGGMDLCFGRWDTHKHELTDSHPHHPCVLDESKCLDKSTEESAQKFTRWVGKDYANTFLAGPRTNFNEPLEDYTINNTSLRKGTGSNGRTIITCFAIFISSFR